MTVHCVCVYYCLASVLLRPPLLSLLCHLFHLELLKMFDRISVDSQQGSKPEPRRWVSVYIRENLIFSCCFSRYYYFFFSLTTCKYTDGCFYPFFFSSWEKCSTLASHPQVFGNKMKKRAYHFPDNNKNKIWIFGFYSQLISQVNWNHGLWDKREELEEQKKKKWVPSTELGFYFPKTGERFCDVVIELVG